MSPTADSPTTGTTRRGPREDRGILAERILTRGRRSFAENGYAGTSLRGVARDAGVDARLVAYYFETKLGLLEACLVPPPDFLEAIARVSTTPLHDRGAALVRNQLRAWEDPDTAAVLRSIILIAAHEPRALDRLQMVFRGGMIGAVAASLTDEERLIRAGLVASQLVGLAMTRYVWRIEPLTTLPADDVVALIGPTVQRYLSGPLRSRR